MWIFEKMSETLEIRAKNPEKRYLDILLALGNLELRLVNLGRFYALLYISLFLTNLCTISCAIVSGLASIPRCVTT